MAIIKCFFHSIYLRIHRKNKNLCLRIVFKSDGKSNNKSIDIFQLQYNVLVLFEAMSERILINTPIDRFPVIRLLIDFSLELMSYLTID